MRLQGMCKGDFNGDGKLDMALTAYRAWIDKAYQGTRRTLHCSSPLIRPRTGVIHLYYGDFTLAGPNNNKYISSRIEYINGSRVGAGFGWDCSTADLNADGYDDLIVGSPW